MQVAAWHAPARPGCLPGREREKTAAPKRCPRYSLSESVAIRAFIAHPHLISLADSKRCGRSRLAIRTFDTRQSTDDDHIDPQAHTLPRIREGSHETCRAALKWVWRTSGAGSIGLVWYVRVVNRPTGAVRSSSPNPNLLVLEEVDQSQEGITLRVRSGNATMRRLLKFRSLESQHLHSPFARSSPGSWRPVQIRLKNWVRRTSYPWNESSSGWAAPEVRQNRYCTALGQFGNSDPCLPLCA